MKVKKRTVWLLTLASLAAVISVFYIFDDNEKTDLLAIFTDETIDGTEILGVNQSTTATVNSESDLFQEIRLEQTNKRSQLRTQLTQKAASAEFSAEEKNQAFNDMEELIKLESSEAMLEMLIKSVGYSDALVRIEGEKVAVTVMSDEYSKQLANEIVYLIRSELDGNVNVTVKMEPYE